jgi:hypothetical protein
MSRDDDFLTPLAQGAAQLRELFEAYVAAGFTERQALQLLKALIRGLTP